MTETSFILCSGAHVSLGKSEFQIFAETKRKVFTTLEYDSSDLILCHSNVGAMFLLNFPIVLCQGGIHMTCFRRNSNDFNIFFKKFPLHCLNTLDQDEQVLPLYIYKWYFQSCIFLSVDNPLLSIVQCNFIAITNLFFVMSVDNICYIKVVKIYVVSFK